MNNVNILIVVDSMGATASGNLRNNVYMIDTNNYLGSWNEGSSDLHTVCRDGQMLTWMVSPVSPSEDVEIAAFGGAMVDGAVCRPQKQGIEGDVFWEGRVETRGMVAPYGYTVTLTFDGRSMSFSAYIKVV